MRVLSHWRLGSIGILFLQQTGSTRTHGSDLAHFDMSRANFTKVWPHPCNDYDFADFYLSRAKIFLLKVLNNIMAPLAV